MADTTHHEHVAQGSDSGAAIMIGVFVLIALFILAFFYFGLGRMFTGGQTNTQTPAVSIPEKVDVNVNQPK